MTSPAVNYSEIPAGTDIVSVTIWREARGEGYEGMRAVGWVIDNRAASGKSYFGAPNPVRVCLQPFQFSCWLHSDPQHGVYPKSSDPLFTQAMRIWSSIQDERDTEDPTGGALYYCNPKYCKNPFDNPKYVQTAEIGHHVFYKAV